MATNPQLQGIIHDKVDFDTQIFTKIIFKNLYKFKETYRLRKVYKYIKIAFLLLFAPDVGAKDSDLPNLISFFQYGLIFT